MATGQLCIINLERDNVGSEAIYDQRETQCYISLQLSLSARYTTENERHSLSIFNANTEASIVLSFDERSKFINCQIRSSAADHGLSWTLVKVVRQSQEGNNYHARSSLLHEWLHRQMLEPIK